ncbi:MAG: cytochrome C oxidase subunit IV family protein [Thermoflexibacter sp.]|jgi:cytochrome c oxidase subunit IV|nr:cytochrome C oxidase subunit IV family protein [Thermoflexibacter sp.]
MAHTEHSNAHQGGGLKNPVVKRLLVVTGILTALTVLEFIIAFAMEASMLKNSIFAVLTVFKAFYIVGEFMHLKHEVKALIWSIVIPLAFILWFIVAMLKEGSAH